VVAVSTLDWHVGDVDAHSDSAVGKVDFRHSDHVAGVMGVQRASKYERMSMSGRSSRNGRPVEAYPLDEDLGLQCMNGDDLRETPVSLPGARVGVDRSSGVTVGNSPS